MNSLSSIQVLELIAVVVALVTLFGVSLVTWAIFRDTRDDSRSKSWPARYMKRNSYAREAASQLILEAEQQFEISLSWAAREMLILPVEEAYELGREFNAFDVRNSIFLLVEAARLDEEHESPTSGPSQLRTAKSVVKAFYSRFCRIPPFCDGRGR